MRTKLPGTGIYFSRQYNKYHARFYKNGRYFHIGRFNTLEEAIEQREAFVAQMRV